MRARRVAVHGRVQGVGFRWSTMTQAQALGVHGWVRNRPDGSVECHLEANDEALERMVAWLHHGPAGARVDRAVVTEVEPEGIIAFEIRG